METYVGIDLGGTKLLIGEIDSHGNILKYKKYDSGYFNQQAALEIIKSSLDDYIRTVGWVDKQPLGMGVGLIGRVDPNKGIWLQIDPGRTEPIALAKELSDIYGMPCHIDNDVKSATRAERVWGFGQIYRNFIYLNVGTGIAMGCVVNGRQVRGSHFNAGEVGHVDEYSYTPSSDIKMGDHPVIWTNENKKARNIYFQIGHSKRLLETESFKVMFENAIQWMLDK